VSLVRHYILVDTQRLKCITTASKHHPNNTCWRLACVADLVGARCQQPCCGQDVAPKMLVGAGNELASKQLFHAPRGLLLKPLAVAVATARLSDFVRYMAAGTSAPAFQNFREICRRQASERIGVVATRGRPWDARIYQRPIFLRAT
jgi:hypothetical protein